MSGQKPAMLLRDQLRADLIEAYMARDISLTDAAESMECWLCILATVRLLSKF